MIAETVILNDHTFLILNDRTFLILNDRGRTTTGDLARAVSGAKISLSGAKISLSSGGEASHSRGAAPGRRAGGGLGGCGGKGWGGYGSNSEKAMMQNRSKSGQFMKGRLAQDAGIFKAGKKKPPLVGVVCTSHLPHSVGSGGGHGNAAGKKPLQGKPVHYQDPGESAVCKIDSCNRFVWEVPGRKSEFCSGKHAWDWLKSGGVFSFPLP